jgi:phosphopantetheine adenylyltransferase
MVDTTTIQVGKDTKKFLDSLKEAYGMKTYDAVINQLIQKKSKSMHGFLADVGKDISMKEILKGLRDKHDKY